MHEAIIKTAARFALLPAVRAVALAGSQATLQADNVSDVDLYVYTRTALPVEVRRAIGLEFSSTAQIVDYWGPGLAWDDPTGTTFDTVYFTAGWIEDQIERVMVRCEPSLGYSTCILHTVGLSRPLYDPSGWFGALQRRASQPYPDLLARRIVAFNYPVLRDCFSSYRQQLLKATLRNDIISLNHRVAALLASVFDIIFAINKVPHPGEKRLLDLVEKLCRVRPVHLRADIKSLYHAATSDQAAVVLVVDRLVDSLESLLRSEGWFS